MSKLTHSLAGALALTIAFAPQALGAQEQQQEMERQCTAEVAPEAIQAGAPAVRLIAALSQTIGPVSGLEAPEASGISLASPEDLPRSEMANEGEESAPSPIELTGEQNRLTVWLNTEEANPGTHTVTFKGEAGTCQAQVTVAEPGGSL